MAERRPPGFNVPLGFYDGPEVKSIPRRIRAAAIGVWTLCGAFSANKLQDGYVGPETLKELGCTDAIRAALKSTKGPDGEPDPLWIDARDGGIQFSKWVKYQRSRAEVKAYRDSEAERKREARRVKSGTTTVGSTYVSTGCSSTSLSPNVSETFGEDNGDQPPVNCGDAKTSGRTSAGHPPDHREPKTKTETKNRSTYVSTEATDHKTAGISATPGAELVREIIPKGHPAATLTSLRLQASELINSGTDPDTVKAALQLWCDKPGIGIGRTILASLASEAIKSRASPRAPNGRTPASDAAFAAAQALKTQPARLEIE